MNIDTSFSAINFTPGRNGHKAVAIVAHATGKGTEEGHIRTLCGLTDRVVSSHFFINKGGHIYQFVDYEKDSSWANGIKNKWGGYTNSPQWLKSVVSRWQNPNDFTTSIEHDSADGTLTKPQFSSSVELIKFLANEQGIPLDGDHIVPHNAISSTDCPQLYPWKEFWTAVNAVSVAKQEEYVTEVNEVNFDNLSPGHYMAYIDNNFDTSVLFYNCHNKKVDIRWEWAGITHTISNMPVLTLEPGHQHVTPPGGDGKIVDWVHVYVNESGNDDIVAAPCLVKKREFEKKSTS